MESRFGNFEWTINNAEQSTGVPSRSRILGYFSIDGERNYLANSSKLKYFNPPKVHPVNLDLNEGFNDIVKSEPKIKKVRILQWIDENREKIKVSPVTGRLIEPNFVCGISSLHFFMSAPYLANISWTMFAGKWKGTIYLQPERSGRLELNDESKFWYWGRKFDQYIGSESVDKPSDTTKPIVETEEFRCVYQHQFSNFSVLFSARKEAVLCKEALSDPLPLDKFKFISPRTCRAIQDAGYEKNLVRYKFLKWWINAFLTNTDKVLCGFWDENGIVHELKMYETEELIRRSTYYWNPEECIESCATIMTKIAETVVDDCDKTIYEVSKQSYEDFKIKKLKPSEEKCVVPEWYKDAMNQ